MPDENLILFFLGQNFDVGHSLSGQQTATQRETINLARVPPFWLGALEVRPSTRQMNRDGKSETLEPRVMQVLVALAQANGAVVPRDDLILSCWAGQVVGDNAIQRTISRLRDVAAGLGADCFRLETVNKIGYRLIEIEPSQRPADIKAAQTPPRRRNLILTLFATAAVVLIGAMVFWLQSRNDDAATIAVAAAPGSSNAELASGLAVDLARLAGQDDKPLVFAASSPRLRSNYVLHIAEQKTGDRVQTDVTLSRASSPDLVWTASFSRRSSDLMNLRSQIAHTVSRLTGCALHTNRGAHDTDAQLRRLFSACERLDAEPDETTIELWRRVVANDPANAGALATLAFLEALLGSPPETNGIQSPEAIALRVAAGEHLRKARLLNSRLGMTYGAESLLLPWSHYQDRIAALDRGLTVDPDSAALYDLKSQLLRNVGRMEHAIANGRKAVELEPGSASYHADLISQLAYTGYVEEAGRELRLAEQIWPDDPAIREVRSRYDIRFGDPAALIRKIDAGNTLPNSPSEFQNGVERPFLVARADPTPQNIENAVAQAKKQFRHAPYFYLQTLVAFGRVDDAYALVKGPQILALMQDYSDVLFRVNMRAFRLDRRFMALAERIGLVQYWQSTNDWPDFCADKDMAYDCKGEARRLHPKPA